MKYVFHRGDEVVFAPLEKRNGLRTSYSHCRVIALYDDNAPPAARIRKGNEEMLVRQEELEPAIIHQMRKEALKLEKARQNCAQIIELWGQGYCTVKAMAEKLGVKAVKLSAKFGQARRYGLLKKDNHDDERGTNQGAERAIGSDAPERS
jgi:hypothetical protein